MQNLIRPRPRGAAAAERTPDKPYEFSLGRVGNSAICALLLIVALCLALSPLFVPDPLTPRLIVSAVREIGAFRLRDPLHEGLFSASDRSGDTRPSQAATATAIASYALVAMELRQPATEPLKAFGKRLINEDKKYSIKDLHEGAVIARGASGLTAHETLQLVFDILNLRELGSGFRPDPDHSATLAATAEAIEAIEVVGHDNAFKESDAYGEMINFVSSLKDPILGGFRDAAYAAPSLTATYNALSILKHLPREKLITAIGNNTEQFVFSCQAEDGGFRDFPRAHFNASTLGELTNEESDVVTTAKAVYILQYFEDQSLPSSLSNTRLTATARSVDSAAGYLRSCLSLSDGVRKSYSSKRRSLEGTYMFLRLANDFRTLKLGIPPSLPNLLLALSALCLTAALLLLYTPQLAGPAFSVILRHSFVIFILLSASIALLGYAPLASLFGFIPLGLYLALRFYEASEQDTQDGLSLLCATINGMVIAGSVYAFNRWAPALWLQLRAYTTLTLLFAASSYLTALGVCYFNGMRRMQISLNGAVMSWIVWEAVLFGWVFGRTDALSLLAYRTIGASGYFPLVFWALPFLSWIGALVTAALATYTVAFFTGRVKTN